jgi:amidase
MHHAYQSGQLTARQLVQRYVDRIAAYDKTGPTMNAIITLNAHALDEADRLDVAYRTSGFMGPLHGIPVVVKDQADVAGLPTTLGSVVFRERTQPASILFLLHECIVFYGKLTMPF